MGIIRRFTDGLTNALNGMGGRGDPRHANRYAFCPISHQEIEAAYRGSGLMRKVVDIPAFDMVREWRDWQAEAAQITALEEEERRLGIQAKVMLAEILRGLGGGAIILGAPGDAALPISASLGKGSLQYLHVVNRWQLSAPDWVDDPTDPLFGGPRFWQVTTALGPRRIHPSRVVCFRGDPLPNLMGAGLDDQFWGESRVQRVLDAVQNSDAAQQAFASLITKSRNTIIGIPGLTDLVSTTAGEQQLGARLAALALGEGIYNATLRDAGDGTPGAGETIDHRQVNWAGIPEIMYAFATFVAAVADIPVTRLLGRAAEGMNSSGDSQQKDWNKMVRARQNLSLRPCLDQLDAVLIPSALGSSPADVWWQFAPLDTPTEAEEATRFKTTMEAIEKVQNTGAIPDEAFAKGLQTTLVEGGWMPGLEGALEEVPEDERYGLQPEEEKPELVAANENTVEAMQEQGAITADQARALLTDARPRTLYVSRKLLNGAEFIRWAKGQGFETTTPADELHVTIAFSRTPVDWMKMGSAWDGDRDGKLTVKPGGARLVEPLGDKGAVVLLFASSELSWRHEDMKRNGASFDFDEYQPHVTITYEASANLDLAKVEPYRGELVFGPEIFAEVVEDWEKGVVEA
jgi:phage-related protein (TIGR01555 family)